MSHNDAIVEALAQQRLVIFAGAGTVRDAGLPDWTGLIQGIKQQLVEENKLLTEYVAPIESLLKKQKMSSAIELMLVDIPRNDIVRILRKLLTPTSESKVCETIAQMRVSGIITTNYDRVVETCLLSDSYRLNNSLEKLALVSTAVSSGRQFVLKLHGDIDDELDPADPLVGKGAGFLVISKSDYAVLVQGQRRDSLGLALHSVLQQYSVLFVGYHFSDPDIDQVLRFLADRCRFSKPSWYAGLRDERLPALPQNVMGIEPISSWNDLPAWLSDLSQAAKTLAPGKRAKQPPLETRPWSEEDHRAYIAISQYLLDLESAGLAEHILAAALLEKISNKAEFDLEWLASEIADFTEVGLGLAKALASATARYLSDMKLIVILAEGQFRTDENVVRTLQSRAVAGWSRDRSRFYASIAARLGNSSYKEWGGFNKNLDSVLHNLCINFGKVMAEWVHMGIGGELGWRRSKELVESQFKDKEEARKAKAVLEMLFRQPNNEETPYLYRLLGAAFLSNSVRLDPFASKVVRTTLSSYELFLDSNILLPLLIREHDDHLTMKEIFEETKGTGVRLLVLQCFLNEVCGHLDVAKRIFDESGGDLLALSELVAILGKHANCFIQAYLGSLDPSEIDAGANGNNASLTWDAYCRRYTPQKLREEIHSRGLSLVPFTPGDSLTNRAEYDEVLRLITTEWNRRSIYGSPRPPILNQSEALQFCYIYRRRRQLKASGLAPEVWFLSFETVLANVFKHNVNRWELPPTFPFPAWVAFLDSRLPHAPKNPTAIVHAIVTGISEVFELPDSVALVRKKAFGDRVTTKVEEDALQFELTSYSLISRIERTRAAVLSRGNLRETTAESREARKVATAEIAKDMAETIQRLKKRVLEQEKELLEAKSKTTQPTIPAEKQKTHHNVPPPKRTPKPRSSAHKRRRRF